MSPIPVPEASLTRLRAAYAHFEELATVVIEAMGVDQKQVQRFDLAAGVLVLFEPEDAERQNGVAQEIEA